MRKRSESKKMFVRETACLLLFSGICIVLLSCKKDSKTPEIPPRQQSAAEKRLPEPQPGAYKAEEPNSEPISWNRPRSDERINQRQQMAKVIEDRYGLKDAKVLDAMLNVPRHWFVPKSQQSYAYSDRPLPIGYDQTISQPFIVAYMTSLLELTEGNKVLEVGTGSGYQAAVLTEFTPYIYTIEIVEPLAKAAQKTLHESGYTTVRVKIGDGYKGWPQFAPFDAIIVTCAPDHIPPVLLEQLKPDGKMVIPVGGRYRIQDLILVSKDKDGRITKKSRMPVSFVPMIRDKTR